MTRTISKVPLLALAVASAGLLASCGGGSGQEPLKRKITLVPIPPVPAPTPTPTPTPTPIPTPTPAPAPTPTPTATFSGTVKLMSEGDSLSVRMAATHVAGYADTHRNITIFGQAVGGSTIEPNNGLSLAERFDTDMALAPTHMTVFIGANDMTNFRDASDPASQPDAWLASLWTYVGKLKARGIKVAVGTLLPQCYPNNPTYNQSFNRRRAIVNAAIRRAVGTKIDDVFDFAADPEIGDDIDACNATYYMDPVHPNSAGQQRMYAVYSVVADKLITK